MKFVFISSIDPLLLIPWLLVLGLAVPIVFYFKYFSDVNFSQIFSRYYDIKDKKEKRKAPCISKSEKDLPPERICPHPKNHVLDHPNCKDIKRVSADKKEMHKVPRIGEAEKDLLPDISRPHPNANILDPRGYKGIRIIWAILGAFFISFLFLCCKHSGKYLHGFVHSLLGWSTPSYFVFLFSALFPVTILSLFVIIGERNNKKFLYCSLIGVALIILFAPSMAIGFALLLALVTLFINSIN